VITARLIHTGRKQRYHFNLFIYLFLVEIEDDIFIGHGVMTIK